MKTCPPCNHDCNEGRTCPERLCAPLRTKDGGGSVDTECDEVMEWFADMAKAGRTVLFWGALVFLVLLAVAVI